MIPKSGNRFSEKIMLQCKIWGVNRKVETGFPKRSCSNKKLERHGDPTMAHPVLAVFLAWFPAWVSILFLIWAPPIGANGRTGAPFSPPRFKHAALDPRRDEVEL
jgi:hypothetical protein